MSQNIRLLAEEGRTPIPERAFQILIVLSSEPETILAPSGENATEVTGQCVLAAWNRITRLISQTRIVMSLKPDTICVSSGEQCTASHRNSWPCKL